MSLWIDKEQLQFYFSFNSFQQLFFQQRAELFFLSAATYNKPLNTYVQRGIVSVTTRSLKKIFIYLSEALRRKFSLKRALEQCWMPEKADYNV